MADVTSSVFKSPTPGSRAGAAADGLGWQEPPNGLKLEQVHYLVRHGERTPVRTRLQNANPPIPEAWNLCHAGRRFQAAVIDLAPSSSSQVSPPSSIASDPLGPEEPARGSHSWSVRQGAQNVPVSNGTLPVQRLVESEYGKARPTAGQEGECLLGELTDLGRLSTLRVGRELRKLYVDKLGFLPSTITDHSQVYFRSTNMSRTVESLQQVVNGLMPGSALGIVPRILIRNGTSENLLPNTFGCARLRMLDRSFADAAARALNHTLEPLDAEIAPHNDGRPPRIDGHPRLNGLFDTVRAAQAHGIPVPEVFTKKETSDRVEPAIIAEWFSGYWAEDPQTRTQFRRLSMHRFLEDLQRRMQSKAVHGEKEPLKLAVYSTHDTALAGLLSTLDSFDFRWPAFTATVGVELFRDTRAKPSLVESVRGYLASFSGADRPMPQHYVRLRYGDQTLRLPGCAAAGSHLPGSPEFCTLDAFRGIVHSLRHPQGLSWEKECEEGSGARSSK